MTTFEGESNVVAADQRSRLQYHYLACPVLLADYQGGRADVLLMQQVSRDGFGQPRIVVNFRKMGQEQPFQSGVQNFRQQCCCIDIGEVPMPGFDALFQVPRIRTIQEHFFVVVRFQYQHPAVLQFFGNQPSCRPEIGGYTHFTFPALNRETDRVTGIVSYGERVDEQVSKGKRITRLEFGNRYFLQNGTGIPIGRIADEYRNPVFATENPDPSDMIRMFMADKQGIEVCRAFPERGQPALYLPCGKPGIDEDCAFASFNKQRIAFAAAGELTDLHGSSGEKTTFDIDLWLRG